MRNNDGSLSVFTNKLEFKSESEMNAIHAQKQWTVIAQVVNKNIGNTSPFYIPCCHLFAENIMKLEMNGYEQVPKTEMNSDNIHFRYVRGYERASMAMSTGSDTQ